MRLGWPYHKWCWRNLTKQVDSHAIGEKHSSGEMRELATVVTGVEAEHDAAFLQTLKTELRLEVLEEALRRLHDGEVVHHGVAGAHACAQSCRAEFHACEQTLLEFVVVLRGHQALDFAAIRWILLFFVEVTNTNSSI